MLLKLGRRSIFHHYFQVIPAIRYISTIKALNDRKQSPTINQNIHTPLNENIDFIAEYNKMKKEIMLNPLTKNNDLEGIIDKALLEKEKKIQAKNEDITEINSSKIRKKEQKPVYNFVQAKDSESETEEEYSREYKSGENIEEEVRIKEEFEEYLEDDIFEDIKCKGCGTELQTKNKQEVGYIPREKVINYLSLLRKSEKKEEAVPRDFHQIMAQIEKHGKRMEKIMKVGAPNKNPREKPFWASENMDLDVLEELNNEGLLNRSGALKHHLKQMERDWHITCNRCEALSHHNELPPITRPPIADLREININKALKAVTKSIKKGSTIIKVMDITNWEGSLIPQLIDLSKQKEWHLVIVINRLDVLPKYASKPRVETWCRKYINDLMKGTSHDAFLVSSKTGEGFKPLINKLILLAKQRSIKRKPSCFVLGNTNVGKSTFINKLIQATNRYPSTHKQTAELFSEETRKFICGTSKLTESTLPGTTLGIVKVKSANIGFKLFDTPGLPNHDSMLMQFEDYKELMCLSITKKILPHSWDLKQGDSVWIGGICKLDILNGASKYFTFFVSGDTTIHKSKIEKSWDCYNKLAGDLLRPILRVNYESVSFTKHEITLQCTEGMKKSSQEIVINGLGWIGVTGTGTLQLYLHLPSECSYYIRESPLMPHEISVRGLAKLRIGTVHENTRKNVKLRELFKLRRKDLLLEGKDDVDKLEQQFVIEEGINVNANHKENLEDDTNIIHL